MGSRRDADDNAVADTFFATLKKELVNRRSWPSRVELQSAVFEYIEAFDDRQRRDSAPGCCAQPATNNPLCSVVEINHSNNNNQHHQLNPAVTQTGGGPPPDYRFARPGVAELASALATKRNSATRRC